MYRKFKVIVDGIEICKIKNSETEHIDIASGKHEIYVKIDWQKSNKIEFLLKENEQSFFQIDIKSPNGIKYYVILLCGILFLISGVSLPPYSIIGFIGCGYFFSKLKYIYLLKVSDKNDNQTLLTDPATKMVQ